MAGAETIASTLVAAIYFISRDKAILERLRNVLRSVVKRDADLEYNDVRNLEYLDAVINETSVSLSYLCWVHQ